jgi:hypothetical protein
MSQIKALDVHAMLRLNHGELAGNRLSLLERATSIVSLRTTELAPRFSIFKRPSREEEQEGFEEEENHVPDESEEGLV